MSLRDYFERRAREGSWAALYDDPPGIHNYNFLTRRAAVERLLAGDGPFERALDLGCGTGDYAAVAKARGAAYHGIDFAPGMLAAARERAGREARFAVADGERLPYADGAFDLVLGLGYIAYFADPGPALGEIRRVLRPGGTAVLQVSKPDLVGAVDRALFDRAPRNLPPGWVNVRYSQRALDRRMEEAGFRRTGFAFNSFNTLPGFLRRRYPNVFVRWSELLTRTGPGLWRFLAVNYIGKYARE